MPVIQYVYAAEGSGESCCFISSHCAKEGDLIEHDGELFVITKVATWWQDDDICSLFSEFIQLYPVDAFYSLDWQRPEPESANG